MPADVSLRPPIPTIPRGATMSAAAEVLRARFGDRPALQRDEHDAAPAEAPEFHGSRTPHARRPVSGLRDGIHFLHAVEDGWAQGEIAWWRGCGEGFTSQPRWAGRTRAGGPPTGTEVVSAGARRGATAAG